MKRFLVWVVFACAFAAGCVTRVGSATVLSTKNIDLRKTLHRADLGRKAVGIDVKRKYLFWEFKDAVSLDEATDLAIESCPGAVALVNVRMTYSHWRLWPLFGRTSFKVVGNPIYEVE